MCGRGHLRQLPPVMRLACDFPDGRVMRVGCVAYVIGRALCKRCGKVNAARAPVIPGTCLDPRALGFVEEYYAKRGTDGTSRISSRRSTALTSRRTRCGTRAGP